MQNCIVGVSYADAILFFVSILTLHFLDGGGKPRPGANCPLSPLLLYLTGGFCTSKIDL